MKICVTASSQGLSAPVDGRFGRAPFIVLVDSEVGTAESHSNEAASAGHGAGTQAAQFVGRSGAGVLLTAHCGPKAFEVLNAAGIEVFSAPEGSVLAACDAWKKGELERLNDSDTPAGRSR